MGTLTIRSEATIAVAALKDNATAGAVIDAANEVKWPYWNYCPACDTQMPVRNTPGKECMWCGQNTGLNLNPSQSTKR